MRRRTKMANTTKDARERTIKDASRVVRSGSLGPFARRRKVMCRLLGHRLGVLSNPEGRCIDCGKRIVGPVDAKENQDG
jgi:hypothetical protein